MLARALFAPDLRVLTVRPPWSWAIAWGDKTTENRSTLWTYRGPVLIHAGAGWSPAGAADPRVAAAYGRPIAAPARSGGRLRHPSADAADPERRIVHSAIVAAAEIVDAHHALGSCCAPWGDPDGVHVSLADVSPLSHPIPWRHGGLGLVRAPVGLVEEVAALLFTNRGSHPS